MSNLVSPVRSLLKRGHQWERWPRNQDIPFLPCLEAHVDLYFGISCSDFTMRDFLTDTRVKLPFLVVSLREAG